MYTYDDMLRLPLPGKEHALFMDRLIVAYNLPINMSEVWIANYQMLPDVGALINTASANSYMSTPAYALASNGYEKAKAAFEGPSVHFEKNTLDIWLECIKDLTAVEKVMQGWYKV